MQQECFFLLALVNRNGLQVEKLAAGRFCEGASSRSALLSVVPKLNKYKEIGTGIIMLQFYKKKNLRCNINMTWVLV